MTESNNEALLLNTLRLLFVEDDPDASLELAHYLKKRVSSLAVAANGREALDLCGSHTFDVILSDLRMPEMDGMTFIRHLRTSGVQTPVVIMSAFSDSETILQAVDLGIVKYCVKPVNIVELTAALSRVASERLIDAGTPVLPDKRLLDRQQRLDIEKKIKSGYAHIIKSITGKGPRDVQVSLGSNSLSIQATDILTQMEATLMKSKANTSLLIHLRKTLYTENQEAFENVVLTELGLNASLRGIDSDPENNIDRLDFQLAPMMSAVAQGA